MTLAEATAECRRRWGRDGLALEKKGYPLPCRVGVVRYWDDVAVFCLRGVGATFPEAFANAAQVAAVPADGN